MSTFEDGACERHARSGEGLHRASGGARISDHGEEQATAHVISPREIMASAEGALLVEDHTDAVRGPSVLALHRLHDGRPVHVVWTTFRQGRRNRRCWSRPGGRTRPSGPPTS
ncbi:DUF4258 domain-containing protein [Enterovirga aerilata]|uniref:DUF4258 domain-containing protein n=1 Tax=Enterovirga aerilata TaxID=2730920 RepID=UPI003D2C143F